MTKTFVFDVSNIINNYKYSMGALLIFLVLNVHHLMAVYLCSGSGDKTICTCDVETSKLLHVFNGHKNTVWCVDISPLQSNKNNDNNKSNNIGLIGVMYIQFVLGHLIKPFEYGILKQYSN
ncbi:hypothetical protein RFI_23963 [Reticulomyxa filosa]|uniref:Uncharacterized protein n=1 Tax=Reticulomyxa filosa TaxID=46433 RepID=X6MJ22_RETFI|nr:hypothetical protein RFI_23963 [Reticulomyxa filosa]|eukprot:ETO13412.1 hypothetical protein RFI_23963 [Reticulomyxa filosa]